MLQVDHADHAAPAHQRNGKERFVVVLGKFIEKQKAGISRGVFGDRDRLFIFCDPSGDAFTHVQFQAIDRIGVRILGRSQDEFFAFENIDEAGIALDQSGGKIDDAGQNFVKSIRCGKTDADFVQNLNM